MKLEIRWQDRLAAYLTTLPLMLVIGLIRWPATIRARRRGPRFMTKRMDGRVRFARVPWTDQALQVVSIDEHKEAA